MTLRRWFLTKDDLSIQQGLNHSLRSGSRKQFGLNNRSIRAENNIERIVAEEMPELIKRVCSLGPLPSLF